LDLLFLLTLFGTLLHFTKLTNAFRNAAFLGCVLGATLNGTNARRSCYFWSLRS
jgi:hypothetical protein